MLWKEGYVTKHYSFKEAEASSDFYAVMFLPQCCVV
jgi:hypothetical protein